MILKSRAFIRTRISAAPIPLRIPKNQAARILGTVANAAIPSPVVGLRTTKMMTYAPVVADTNNQRVRTLNILTLDKGLWRMSFLRLRYIVKTAKQMRED